LAQAWHGCVVGSRVNEIASAPVELSRKSIPVAAERSPQALPLSGSVNIEAQPDHDHEDGVKLTLGDSKNLISIGLSDILNPNSEDRIEDEKGARDDAMPKTWKDPAHGVKNEEDEEPFENSFIKLRRMPGRGVVAERFEDIGILTGKLFEGVEAPVRDLEGSIESLRNRCGQLPTRIGGRDLKEGVLKILLVAVLEKRFGKLDGPPFVRTRRRAVEFPVDEIGDPPEENTQRCHDTDAITQPGPGELMPPGIIEREKHDSQDSAMGRHSPIPHPDNGHGILRDDAPTIPRNHVEQDVADPSSDENPEDCGVSYDIRHLLLLDHPKLSSGKSHQDQIGHEKAHDIGKTIPAKLDRFRDLKDDRIEIVDVAGEHEGISYHRWPYRKPTELGNHEPAHKSEISRN